MLPYLLAFIAVCLYSMLGPIAKRGGLTLSPFLFISISSFILAVLSFLIAVLSGKTRAAVLPDLAQVKAMVVFSLVNLVAYVAYLKSIELIPVAHYDMIGALGILLGAVFSLWLVGEPFHGRYIPAFVLIALGIFIGLGPTLRAK